MSQANLDAVCVCGHTLGKHRGVPVGQPIPCKADDDTCPCENFQERERDTDAPPPPDGLDELRAALAHCADLCIQTLQRLDLGERRFAHVERRVDRIERHLGLTATE